MIDPIAEPPIPLMQVPQIPWLPRRRNGRKLHFATVFRWAQRGLHGVKLETLQFGGTKCTSEAALNRFFVRLSAEEAVPAPTPKIRRQQIEEAERALNAMGV